ncbi:hypothetical protein ABW20_dc0105375 [Dactylellina cionopaga]|nr:hypothetical protein ABW20_dc0105375 [Dactylellina cionopaga]
MQDKGMLPTTLEYQDIYQRLLSGADGMFLWAHLMIGFLGSEALTPWQRYQTITSVNFPEGLEMMYDRILAFIKAGNSAERQIAERVLSWVLKDNSAMTTMEMRVALRLAIQGVQGPGDEISDDAIIISCAGLVEKFSDTHKNTTIFRPIHLSLVEYLDKFSKASGKQRWFLDAIDMSQELALVCLSYLTYSVPAGPLSGQIGLRSNKWAVQDSFPFIKHATMNWTRHLRRFFHASSYISRTDTAEPPAIFPRSILSTLDKFIAQKAIVMAWIEAYYLFHDHYMYKNVLENLEAISSELRTTTALAADNDTVVMGERLRQLATDLRDLDTNWKTVLVEDPYMLWLDVTAFSKSEFWLESNATKVEEFDTFATECDKGKVGADNFQESDHNLSHIPFAVADSVSQDGFTLGVLTVYYPM